MYDFEQYSQLLIKFALASPRLAGAFLILPLISQHSMPSMVRNIFLIALAVSVFPYLVVEVQLTTANPLSLGFIVIKELFIGVIIGFSFGIIFWVLESAGQIIDNKVGTTTAQIVDPISGHETSLNGKFLSYLCGFVFVSFGGLMIFLDILFESYAIWPIVDPLPKLNSLGQLFFINKFDELMRLALLLSAPALLILTLVEFGLGLINRYAKQLNIFSLSLSIKAWLGVLVLLLMLATVIEFIVNWFDQQRHLLQALKQVL